VAVREILTRGEIPPAEFTRPEVVEILIDAERATIPGRSGPGGI